MFDRKFTSLCNIRRIIDFMRETRGDQQIVEMIAEEFEKLKDIRSFNFDPVTFLKVRGTANSVANEYDETKYL